MAKVGSRLRSMRVDELLKLRDDVDGALSERTAELKKQLGRLEKGDWVSSGRKGAAAGRRRRKLQPKYRDPDDPSMVWAGRGARPRWMDDRIKAGAKQEDFLIAAGAATSRKRSVGKKRKRKGRRAKSSVSESA